VNVTAYGVAERFIGIKEVPGTEHNPQILAMLRLDDVWPEGDEVPWCSAFVNWVAWLLRLRRSESLRARSWLEVGDGIPLHAARPGFDVVVLKRGGGDQPGAEVLDAPGHVGFFSSAEFSIHGGLPTAVDLLGGNQGDRVSIARYPADRILGVRRLHLDYGRLHYGS